MNRLQKNLVTAVTLFAIVAIIAAISTTTMGRTEYVKKDWHKGMKMKMQEWNSYVSHFSAWEKENTLDI